MESCRILRLLWAFGVLICFASSVWATPTTNITLTGVGGLPPGALGGVYTSPYLGTVGTETNVQIICDDFVSETYSNETWTAYVTNLSTGPLTFLKWQGYYSWDQGQNKWVFNSDQATGYTVAAYLATKILQAQDATSQEDYSYALWGLFDAGDPQGPFLGDYLKGTPDFAAAQDLLRKAESEVQNQHRSLSDYANVTIYSYDSAAGVPTCPDDNCPPPPQEFIRVSMAEPPYPAVLGLDLLAAVGLIVVFRRRLTSMFSLR